MDAKKTQSFDVFIGNKQVNKQHEDKYQFVIYLLVPGYDEDIYCRIFGIHASSISFSCSLPHVPVTTSHFFQILRQKDKLSLVPFSLSCEIIK